MINRLWDLFTKPAARYPADPRAVFILALSVFSGITALALNVAPDSLGALLPSWGVILWGLLLSAGSAMTLIGMAFQTVSGVIVEQIGSVVVGVTTVYYSILAIWIIGPGALQGIGIILAWGLACFMRWAQLQALLKTTRRTVIKQAIEQQVREAVEGHVRTESRDESR